MEIKDKNRTTPSKNSFFLNSLVFFRFCLNNGKAISNKCMNPSSINEPEPVPSPFTIQAISNKCISRTHWKVIYIICSTNCCGIFYHKYYICRDTHVINYDLEKTSNKITWNLCGGFKKRNTVLIDVIKIKLQSKRSK